jgi:hypothetical protein
MDFSFYCLVPDIFKTSGTCQLARRIPLTSVAAISDLMTMMPSASVAILLPTGFPLVMGHYAVRETSVFAGQNHSSPRVLHGFSSSTARVTNRVLKRLFDALSRNRPGSPHQTRARHRRLAVALARLPTCGRFTRPQLKHLECSAPNTVVSPFSEGDPNRGVAIILDLGQPTMGLVIRVFDVRLSTDLFAKRRYPHRHSPDWSRSLSPSIRAASSLVLLLLRQRCAPWAFMYGVSVSSLI